MAVLTKAQIASLPLAERLALIEELWDSLETPPLDPVMDTAHREIVEKRLADYDPKTETFLTLDEVCRQVRAR